MDLVTTTTRPSSPTIESITTTRHSSPGVESMTGTITRPSSPRDANNVIEVFVKNIGWATQV